jgi:formylglycine-generating enzyme required for sulfatase activity
VQQDPKDGQWRPAPGYEQHPVVNVTWYGANEYARHYGLRLPTEAEWEYAARGGARSQGYLYSGSNNLDEVGWYYDNSAEKGGSRSTHPVRQKKANELGLYDMSGNVWEWCADWYGEKYYEQFRSAPAVNPTGPTEGDYAVLRGGSWYLNVILCRAAYRYRNDRNLRILYIGFRCARVASEGGQ